MYRVVEITGFGDREVFGPASIAECIEFYNKIKRVERVYGRAYKYDIVKTTDKQ